MRPFFMSYVRGKDRGQAALLPAAIELIRQFGYPGAGEQPLLQHIFRQLGGHPHD